VCSEQTSVFEQRSITAQGKRDALCLYSLAFVCHCIPQASHDICAGANDQRVLRRTGKSQLLGTVLSIVQHGCGMSKGIAALLEYQYRGSYMTIASEVNRVERTVYPVSKSRAPVYLRHLRRFTAEVTLACCPYFARAAAGQPYQLLVDGWLLGVTNARAQARSAGSLLSARWREREKGLVQLQGHLCRQGSV